MTAQIPILEACIFATVLCGFFGIIFKQNLMMKILSMDVMSTGVIGYYVLVAARRGLFTPIASIDMEKIAGTVTKVATASVAELAEPIAYADPVPQAVILTAIVIGFSIQALMLVGVMKLSRQHPTLEIQEIERSNLS